jgi:hypothetical protein
MGGIGRQNPLPFQVGGGTTELERIWFELRKQLGEKGPGPVGCLEDRWRFAKACGMAKVTTMGRRALMQFFPRWATDHLEVYESLLRVPQEDTEEGRRLAVAAAFTAQISAVVPEIRSSLQDIDSSIDVIAETESRSVHFKPGKYLKGRLGTDVWYGVNEHSAYPTFSSHFVLTVFWPGGPVLDPATLDRVKRYLNDTLPSWFDWRIVNAVGFYLDGYNDSRLDLTAFS